jgi:O-antigen ligase
LSSCPTISILEAHANLRTRKSLRKPHDLLETLVIWLLFAFAFVLPSDLRLPDGKSIALRLGCVCLLVGIAGVLKRRSWVLPERGFWVLVAFLLWSSCTLAWARFPDLAQHKVLIYWVLFAISAVIPQYAWDPRVRARLLKAYVAGCWLGVVGTIANFVLARPYAPGDELEMEGRYTFSTDPNYLGLALVLGIPLAVYGASTATARWQKVALRLYVPAGVIGVLLTGSRGAAIALLAVILVYGVFASPRVRLLLLSGAALCVSLAWLVPLQFSERFINIPEQLRYGSLSDRRELWDEGAAVAREHPFMGIGADAATGTLAIAAHNTPLELIMEGGAVSLALFYGVFLIGVGKTWKRDRREGWTLLAVCVAWFVGGLSLSWETNTVTWFLAVIVNSTLPAQRVLPVTDAAGAALTNVHRLSVKQRGAGCGYRS